MRLQGVLLGGGCGNGFMLAATGIFSVTVRNPLCESVHRYTEIDISRSLGLAS